MYAIELELCALVLDLALQVLLQLHLLLLVNEVVLADEFLCLLWSKMRLVVQLLQFVFANLSLLVLFDLLPDVVLVCHHVLQAAPL